MSTTGDDWVADHLREAERGEAAGHTGYRFPRWLPWAVGTWAFSFLAGMEHLGVPAGNVWMLAHLALAIGYGIWDHCRQAVTPRGRWPREYRSYYAVLAGAAVLLFGIAGWSLALGGWTGPLVAGMGFGVVAWGLVHAYNRTSAATAQRLA